MTAHKIVVIGAVAAGPKAAARARRLDPEAEITIVERGEIISYAGCGMPYFISGAIKELRQLVCTPTGVPRDPAFFQATKNIKVLNLTEAVTIDRTAKEVEVLALTSGERRHLPYDKLVIATGGLPLVPPIEGVNLGRVYRLNHPDDAVAIREAATCGEVKRAAIVGGGLIGMEATEALAANGIEVTIVEMLPYLMGRFLDPEMAAYLTRHVNAKGAHVYVGGKVVRLVGDAEGKVTKVITEWREIETEMVLLAGGVRPNVRLTQEAGLALGQTGAIAVNEYLQTSDPDIYAGGDCVENVHMVTGQKVYTPMGSTANKHGRVIGDNITGGRTAFPGVVGTTVLKVFDFNVGRTGLSESEARRLGYEVVTSLAPAPDCSDYYPDSELVLLKLVAEAGSGRVLGGQAVGAGDAIKRIDVLATALSFGAKAADIGMLDLGYAPPYSTAIDVVAHAANIVENKRAGLVRGVSGADVKAMLDAGEDFVWLDVRSPQEYEQSRIEDRRVKLIPLGRLRSRLEELPRDKPIVVFCKVSLRGYEAARALAGAGYSDVRIMDGGIVAWPYEVTGAA